MNQYLVSYFYRERNGNYCIGRNILNLNSMDIVEYERSAARVFNVDKVVTLNVVKLKSENKISMLIKKLFRKRKIRRQFREAKKKEFNC